MSNSKYNICLDFIKGLACVFVVWMHCEFPGRTGVVVQAISRFCVPFFFMVSGYFSGNMSNTVSKVGGRLVINKKVKHIFKLTFWAALFYLVWAIIRNQIWHDNTLSISISQAFIWLFFNEPVVVGGHLWFLFALLYDYILVSFFDGKRVHAKQFLFGAISMTLLYVLGQLIYILGIRFAVPPFVRDFVGVPLPETVSVPNFLYRNWLIEGFAFFMLGRWIKEKGNNIKIGNTTVVIVFVVSTLLCVIERKVMGRDFGVNICTLPQVFALFLYAVKNPERHAGFIQRIGKECSLMVYILHIFVWQVISKVYDAIGVSDNTLALYLLPILVVIMSIILALVFNWIVSKFKKKPQIVKS